MTKLTPMTPQPDPTIVPEEAPTDVKPNEDQQPHVTGEPSED